MSTPEEGSSVHSFALLMLVEARNCRYSRDPRLRLLRRWRMPTEADIGESGLPCEGYPSDHLSLCAVFEIS